MSKPFLSLFVASLYLAFIRADYTIDDSNYSILKFSENPAGPVWGPFGSDTGEVLEIRLSNGTMQTIDATQCYDGTFTYAACNASNNCAVQFSFTGSGITIYVLQAGPQGMSASLSIDSGSVTTATLGAPPPPQYYIPRVTLFNVQNISSGTHTVVMTVLDWNGGISGMMLDYINVNQATATPTISPSPSPTPSPSGNATSAYSASSTASLLPSSSLTLTSADPQTSSQQTSSTGTHASARTSSVETPNVVSVMSIFSSQSYGVATLPPGVQSESENSVTPTSSSTPTSKNDSDIAVTVGGGVGGGIGLLALIGLTFFCFRRRSLRYEQTLDERRHPFFSARPAVMLTNADLTSSSSFDSSVALAAIPSSGPLRPLQSGMDSEASSIPNPTALSSSSPITNISHARVSSGGNISATSSVPVSVGVAVTTALQDRDTSTLAQLAQPALCSASIPLSPARPPNPKFQRGQSASLDVAAHENAAAADEQADFINGLFNNNVPAPVVARVLGRMLADPQSGGSVTWANDPELHAHIDASTSASRMHSPMGGASWLSTMSDDGDEETTGMASPSYDYARAQR